MSTHSSFGNWVMDNPVHFGLAFVAGVFMAAVVVALVFAAWEHVQDRIGSARALSYDDDSHVFRGDDGTVHFRFGDLD